MKPKIEHTHEDIKALFAESKRLNPMMRRKTPVGRIVNGGSRGIMECCLCGETHSFATNWPFPKHASKFCAYHNEARCVEVA